MAKKKVGFSKKKPGITDWKFILMMLGILLVGISVFVLNQKVTYQSDAANNMMRVYACRTFNYNACRKDCKGGYLVKPGNINNPDIDGNDNDGNIRISEAKCKTQCAQTRRDCNQILKNN